MYQLVEVVQQLRHQANGTQVENARIGIGKTHYGFPIVSGQLKVGESGSGKVVNALRNRASEIAEKINADHMILDAAAGIGCPVIASVRGSDYVILVTEPIIYRITFRTIRYHYWE